MDVIRETEEKTLRKQKTLRAFFFKDRGTTSLSESAVSESEVTLGSGAWWGKFPWGSQIDVIKRQESRMPWMKNGEECPCISSQANPGWPFRPDFYYSINNNSHQLHSSKHLGILAHLMIRKLRLRENDSLSKVESERSRTLSLGNLAPTCVWLSLSFLPNDWWERTRDHKTLGCVCFLIPVIPKWVTLIWCEL